MVFWFGVESLFCDILCLMGYFWWRGRCVLCCDCWGVLWGLLFLWFWWWWDFGFGIWEVWFSWFCRFVYLFICVFRSWFSLYWVCCGDWWLWIGVSLVVCSGFVGGWCWLCFWGCLDDWLLWVLCGSVLVLVGWVCFIFLVVCEVEYCWLLLLVWLVWNVWLMIFISLCFLVGESLRCLWGVKIWCWWCELFMRVFGCCCCVCRIVMILRCLIVLCIILVSMELMFLWNCGWDWWWWVCWVCCGGFIWFVWWFGKIWLGLCFCFSVVLRCCWLLMWLLLECLFLLVCRRLLSLLIVFCVGFLRVILWLCWSGRWYFVGCRW